MNRWTDRQPDSNVPPPPHNYVTGLYVCCYLSRVLSVLTLSDDGGGAGHDGVLEVSVSAQRLDGAGLGVPSVLVRLLDPHLLTVQVLHHFLGILHELLHILKDGNINDQ